MELRLVGEDELALQEMSINAAERPDEGRGTRYSEHLEHGLQGAKDSGSL